MKIDGDFEYAGEKYALEYEDCNDFSILPKEQCTQIRSVCFCDGKMVIGLHGDGWAPIGGTIEAGETPEQTLAREVLEEANMEVIEQVPVSYQKVTDKEGKSVYQLRGWCRAKPKGIFVADPDHGVKEIKLIEPKDYKQYFDWGAIGDRIVERAMEIENTKRYA